jgi:large subunit ribosomal protein L1
VLVFAQGEAAQAAQAAGADFVGADDLIARIDKENFFDFDIAIATPDMMGKVGRVGRKLGPRGLMPNPKSGTIVQPEELPRTIREVRGGRVEFRNDKTGLLHVAVGKVSFSEQQIYENIAALMDAVKAAKPSAAKGTYVRSVTFTSTMGPGIPVDPSGAQSMQVGA